MTDPYTPTMADFRRESVNRVPQNRRDEQRAMWDAALAQHDAELRKEIAWEIRAMGSESWDGYTPDEVPGTVAARLAEGGSLEGGESR